MAKINHACRNIQQKKEHTVMDYLGKEKGNKGH